MFEKVSRRIEERMNWKIAVGLGALLVLSLSIIWYANTKSCLFFDCRLEYMGLSIPMDCDYVVDNKEALVERFFGSAFTNTSGLLFTTTKVSTTTCPACQTCLSTTTKPTTTPPTTFYCPGYTPEGVPDYISSAGGDYFTAKPDKIDFRWQKCNPLEDVTVKTFLELKPLFTNITNCTKTVTLNEDEENITTLDCKTFLFDLEECWPVNGSPDIANCTSYFKGTDQTLNYLRNAETVTIKNGGCIVISANCCRCEDGGSASPIQASLAEKYYQEVLNSCHGKPVVCPMAMRSPIGCHPVAACLEGVCRIVNR